MEIGRISNLNSLNRSIYNDEEDGNIITSFSDYLNGALNKANELKIQSDNVTKAFAAGQTDNIHDVMIASEKAGIAMDFVLQVRNKLIDAYNEIMRMQL